MESSKLANKKISCVLIIFLLCLLKSTNQIMIQTQSQYIYPNNAGIASLVPLLEQENLSLLNSDIIVRTELKDIEGDNLEFSYNCTYTIYNQGATMNSTLFLPLDHELYGFLPLDYAVLVNGTHEEIEVIEILDSEYGDALYDIFEYSYLGFLCLDNTELLGNSNTTISIFISSQFSVFRDRTDHILTISYDVGAINVWNDYKNCKIECIATGVQPSYFSNYSDTTPERKCDVTTSGDKTSYLWEWENEEIIENQINVEWLIPRNKPFTFLVHWDSFGILLALISSILFIFSNKIKKMKKEDYQYE